MLEIVFWCLLLLVAYVYVGYPLLLWCLPEKKASYASEHEPRTSVTLLISAFNEAECIAEKIENSLQLNYPDNLLEIIVVSDASDDNTDDIVTAYQDRGVQLLRMETRGGKTLGLNAAVENSSGDIIVFSDANAIYVDDAIMLLAAPFDDERIGAVVGESSYVKGGSDSGRSESLYWRYETSIKVLESRNGSVVGGDGAIYAVRRSLYQPMNSGDLSDFVNPLQVIASGFRCVYEPKALSYEETASDYSKEYRRKVRIVNRAWRGLWKMRSLLNPIRYGAFSLKLWSHKVLRWWVPFMMLGLITLNLVLLKSHVIYMLTLVGQCMFYLVSIIGYSLRHSNWQPAFLRIPFYFCLVNFAGAVGMVEALFGKSYTIWNTVRAGENQS